MKTSRPIILTRVQQNNLKSVSVEFPSKKITVVTGISGSGKSSLVFDTLYAEGQRRYVESLSTYTRQFLEKMPKPDLESIANIPPAIALEQKNHVVGARSSVGTQTEIVDYLRLLYAKIGKTRCMDCSSEVKKLDSQTVLDWACDWLPSRKAMIVAPVFHEGDAPQAKAPPRGKKKFKKKPSNKKGARATASSLAELLKEQGFQRILYKPSRGKTHVFDLEDES
ncbi:MAG: excinuclease ABC subunit A, partial [Bdellovibrionota bacterium]